jgi:hypothetical protein
MQPPSPSSTAPAGLLLLVQATAAMEKRLGVVNEAGSSAPSKRSAAVQLVRRVLGRLSQRETDAPDVAVLAYHGDDSGRLLLQTPLPDASLNQPFVRPGALSRANLAGSLREAFQPHGQARPAEAMAAAYRVVSRWLRRRPGGAPLLVVHVTDGSGLDETFARGCRSLCALSTPAGGVALLHCVLTESLVSPVALPARAEDVPAPWRKLWALSSPLQRAGDAGRALCVNTLPDAAVSRLAQRLCRCGEGQAQRTRGPAWHLEHRALWVQKGGNEPADWQDAYVVDAERGRAAVSDGAGSGIFSRLWADLLTRRLLDDDPAPTDADALARWLDVCRQHWHEAINLPALRHTQRHRVRTVGTGATILALRVQAVAGDAERFAWSAWAVGDSCLFWVRDNRLRATFPAIGSEDFGPSTTLFQTLTDRPPVTPLLADKLGKMGDLFLLATDAVSQMLLHRTEEGAEPDWEAFWQCEETAWRQAITGLRGAGQIEDDDCTLLLVRPLPPRRDDTLDPSIQTPD